ncbi:MAG TPA: ATPase, T2SS/T4P/T4SS family [Acidimicrobiia bacterium]
MIGDVRAGDDAVPARTGALESHDAYDTIRREVLRSIERRRLRPDRDLGEVRSEAERSVHEYQHRAQFGETRRLADPAAVVERIVRSIADLGPLTDLLARPDVEEIFIDGARIAYLDGDGRLRGLAEPTNEDENRRVIDRLLAPSDRQLSAQYPLVQARVLDGGARLTAAIPPVADRLSVTLRRYVVRHVALDGLVRRESLTAPAAAFLGALMQMRSRVVVSGEPGAGKTTLLAALLAATPAHHCIRCCEEIRELSVPFPHGAYYEVRPPGLDGGGAIDLRALVRFTLAMRPDRIVVGEVRGGEAFELTRAMNAGCGFCCTVHANGAVDALDALVNAALMAGENVTERVVRKVFSEALDIVVHVDRDDGRAAPGAGDTSASSVRRQITEIVAVAPSLGDGFTCEPLFVREGLGRPLVWTGAVPARLESRIDRAAGRPNALRALLGADSGGGT